MEKNRNRLRRIVLLFCLCLVFAALPLTAQGAKGNKNYKITPKSTPCNTDFTKYHNYNGKTKHYYVLRSYLEKLENDGGGTLTLQKGVYTITNTLYVASNVTLVFEDGVTLKKGNKTDVKDMKAATSMFQLIRPSNSKKSGVYGGYKGDKNIQFIGKGIVVFDMDYFKDGIAIIMGHNQNVKVKNITFKNMYSGHFIEMDASKNVEIDNCTFMNHKPSSGGNKEAVNLDTPDKFTKGWSQNWSKYDRTPNHTVSIKNSIFKDLERAIGTHRYSLGSNHVNIRLENNRVENVRSGFFGLNWENPVIERNVMQNVSGSGNTGDGAGIFLAGVTNPTIQNNFFHSSSKAIEIRKSYYTSQDGPGRAVTSLVEEEYAKIMLNNEVYDDTAVQVDIPGYGTIMLKKAQ